LKDESTPELIDSVVSNKPVTGFSGWGGDVRDHADGRGR
jgi:hypothetical protein